MDLSKTLKELLRQDRSLDRLKGGKRINFFWTCELFFLYLSLSLFFAVLLSFSTFSREGGSRGV